ncbi:MAG TPA: hypothetical protein VII63_03325 [Caulobacteraceae bacterium]
MGEWGALSEGLERALRTAGVDPLIVPRAHPAAGLAALWRGGVAILAHGRRIWWPNAPVDLSVAGRERAMAVLQHELQHVLEFATGELSALGYLLQPRHWRYDVALAGARWGELGAEQRASLAERLWLAEHGLAPANTLCALRAVIPWA